MKRSVQDLLARRTQHGLKLIDADDSILSALKKLEQTNTSALLLQKNGSVVGIFSERDFVRAAAKQEIDLADPVASIGTQTVYCVDLSYTLESCLRIMSEHHIRHLAVLGDGHVVAVVSMREIMAILVEDKDHEIRNLEVYIAGSALAAIRAPTHHRSLPITINDAKVLEAIC